ncbi:MAG: hypothetical protein MUC87_20265 [Bacteroidia bacterium]|jgi:hypothetical protein|nr:hypothetical protein [Bacteroidia bacterium]
MKYFPGLLFAAFFLTAFIGQSCNKIQTNESAKGLKIIDDYHKKGDSIIWQKNDIILFRESAAGSIKANNRKAADYYSGQLQKGSRADTGANIQVFILEAKNAALKLRMDSYENEEMKDWDSFKSRFNSDMDQINKSYQQIKADSIN